MKWKKLRNSLCQSALLMLCALIMFQCGCAARANKMVPAGFDMTNKHLYTVKVQGAVVGKNSLISDSAFTEALTESILKSGLFKGVVKGEGADYSLDAVISQYNQPWIGINFNISVETKWQLFKSGQPKPLWSDTISTSYKTNLWDAFFAAERLQRTNEGAVRLNIQQGIKHLSAAKF